MQLPSPFVFLLLGAIGLLYWWYTTRGAGSPGAHGSVLETYTKDLTELARQKKVDPVIGRSEEIDRVIHILTRRTKNNPLLIGEPGVGKTAIVEGIACRIAAGDVPEQLKNKRVLMLDLGGLISGTKYRGEFEARMKRLTNEIQVLARIVILFIDEVHMIEQAKGTEGAMNVSDILKPALSRGELQAIGATTWTEYERYIQSDDALNRRFQPVIVGEPSAEATLDILRGVRLLYETYHHVAYTEEALQAAVSLSEKRIHNRFLPDKAIDLIDEAGAKVSIDATHHAKHALGLLHAAGAATASRTAFLSVELRGLQEERAHLERLASEMQDEIEIAEMRDRMTHLIQETEKLKQETQSSAVPEVTAEDIAQVVEEWVGNGSSRHSAKQLS